ncbi:hypothetical protein C8R44DRAFT_222809 [Mycena epipterygia]|nr:hypothetical protein C8R44DRAFT_222809 [Mycena epipterygia]
MIDEDAAYKMGASQTQSLKRNCILSSMSNTKTSATLNSPVRTSQSNPPPYYTALTKSPVHPSLTPGLKHSTPVRNLR